MTTDELRAEFEAWWLREVGPLNFNFGWSNAWLAWQAAPNRASRLAAANALLLNFSKAVADTAFKMRAPNQWTPVFVQMAQEAERQSHLQGAGDE